jgi:hypothetical protein
MYHGLTNTMTDVGNCAEMPRNPRETMEERKVSKVEKLKEEMTAEGRHPNFSQPTKLAAEVTTFSPSLPYLSA